MVVDGGIHDGLAICCSASWCERRSRTVRCLSELGNLGLALPVDLEGLHELERVRVVRLRVRVVHVRLEHAVEARADVDGREGGVELLVARVDRVDVEHRRDLGIDDARGELDVGCLLYTSDAAEE